MTITCECGGRCALSVLDLPVHYEGEIRCQFCGKEVESCGTSRMPVYTLISEPLHRCEPPHVGT